MSDTIDIAGNFLHGSDLQNREWTLTVKQVDAKDSARAADRSVVPGWPVHFEETDKTLVLNVTNTKLAIAAMGTNVREEWKGRKLVVYPAELAECFGQKHVVCLRVRVPDDVPRPFIMPKHLGKDLSK